MSRDLSAGPRAWRTLASQTLGTFAARTTGSVLILVAQVMVARQLGARSYGTYVYVLAWVNLAAVLAKVGLDNTILRFAPLYHSQQDWPRLRGLASTCHRVTLLTSTVISILLLAAASTPIGARAELRWTLIVGALVIPPLALSGLLQAALRSLGRVLISQVPETTIRPVVFLSLLLVFSARSAPQTMGLNLLSTVAALGVGVYWLRGWDSEATGSGPRVREDPLWLSTGGLLLYLAFVNLLVNRLDTLLVGGVLGPEAVGPYSAASRLAFVLQFGLVTIHKVAAPRIAVLNYQDDREQLQHLVTLSCIAVLVFTLPAAAGLLLGGRRLLALFGPNFVTAYPILVVLVIGGLANAVTGPCSLLLTMTGLQRGLAIIMTVSLLVNGILSVLLIPKLGPLGAAVGTAAATLGWNAAAALFAGRRLEINCFEWCRPSGWRAAAAPWFTASTTLPGWRSEPENRPKPGNDSPALTHSGKASSSPSPDPKR